MLRSTYSAGSSVCSCRLLQIKVWVVEATGKRTNVDTGTCGTQRHSRISLLLWWDKNPVSFAGVPPQRHQLELFLCYLVTAPRLNYFKDGDIWDSAMGSLGWAGKEAWSDCLNVGRQAGHPSAHWNHPQWKGFNPSSGAVGATAKVIPGWSDRKTSWTGKQGHIKMGIQWMLHRRD